MAKNESFWTEPTRHWGAFAMNTGEGPQSGLTKREYAAIAAMQGILSAEADTEGGYDPKLVAADAVRMADYLFDELEKNGEGK